jgi:putative SOS response-associated peptidase YedK
VLKFGAIISKHPSDSLTTTYNTAPNSVVGRYHDRMPVILEKEDENVWLNPDVEADQLHPLLKPYHDDKMDEWEVGADARDPRNDCSEVIKPIKISKQINLF